MASLYLRLGIKIHVGISILSIVWLQMATFYLSLGIRIHVGISILGIVNINGVSNGEDKVGLIDIGARTCVRSSFHPYSLFESQILVFTR